VIVKAALQRLRTAGWLRNETTQRVFTLLDGRQGRTRAVGGAVRDTLSEHRREDAAEIDLATELVPGEVMQRAARAEIAAYPTGLEHGTVTLRVDGVTYEVTTLREDIETDGRHAVVRFGYHWTRDAERRDFTMNALYCDMEGELFDPVNGLDDCLEGRVRFIGEAARRIAEDRLRVYRFFRFTASHGGGFFDEDGIRAVTKAANDLGGLSAERVGAEMRRMLALPAVVRSIEAMAGAGVISLPAGLAEWLAAYEWHAHRPNFVARLALFSRAIDMEYLRERWRLSNDESSAARAVLKAALLLGEFRVEEAAYRYPAALADAVDVAAALKGWTEAGKAAVVQRLTQIEVPLFPISGNDLIAAGMVPGPGLGKELDRLEREWIKSGFALTRGDLITAIRR
jgi:poly(A) polymerase